MNKTESKFYALWLSQGGPEMQNEVMMKDVVPGWKGQHRLDFYDPVNRIAIEINGGTFRGFPSHSHGMNLRRDYVKNMVLQTAGIMSISLDRPMSHSPSIVKAVIEGLINDDLDALYPVVLAAQKKKSKKKKNKTS